MKLPCPSQSLALTQFGHEQSKLQTKLLPPVIMLRKKPTGSILLLQSAPAVEHGFQVKQGEFQEDHNEREFFFRKLIV
jgi:hypothetical protein